ncbi:hypothetical protein BOX15_Mlig006515g1, partial [Macrostomum lignano]
FIAGLFIAYCAQLTLHLAGQPNSLFLTWRLGFATWVCVTANSVFVWPLVSPNSNRHTVGYELISCGSVPVTEAAGGRLLIHHPVDARLGPGGTLISLRCAPCGQLLLLPDRLFLEPPETTETTADTLTANPEVAATETAQDGEVFKGYTEAEFDRLVDMFQQLKSHNQHLINRLESLESRNCSSTDCYDNNQTDHLWTSTDTLETNVDSGSAAGPSDLHSNSDYCLRLLNRRRCCRACHRRGIPKSISFLSAGRCTTAQDGLSLAADSEG